jgi:hypothetical protein
MTTDISTLLVSDHPHETTRCSSPSPVVTATAYNSELSALKAQRSVNKVLKHHCILGDQLVSMCNVNYLFCHGYECVVFRGLLEISWLGLPLVCARFFLVVLFVSTLTYIAGELMEPWRLFEAACRVITLVEKGG